MADPRLVADFDANGGNQSSLLGLPLERRQQVGLLFDREVLMAAATFGPALGGGQAPAQIIRPDPPDVADA